jgi:hypothetical protein
MAHEITISFSREMPVLNSDIRIVVKQDSKKFGTLTISKGAIDWLPRNAKDGGSSELHLTWKKFAVLMESAKNQKAKYVTNGKGKEKPISDEIGAATQKSFQNLPIPASKADLGMKRHFSDEEFALIRKGFIPGSMDDPWFIYFDDARQGLFFHRSRTGFCIYLLRFKQNDGEAEICESWVNRDLDQYSETCIDYDVEVALWLIDFHLLHKFRDFPTKSCIY